MDSSVNTKQADPRDVGPGLSTQDIELVARADERLAHAYEQISRMEYDAARKKAVNKLRRPSRGRPALRGFIALLLTAGVCFAAFASQSYGETARLMISRWAPQLASSLPSGTPKLAAQQSLPTVQVAAADAAISQLSPPAQTVPQDAAPVPIPPEVTQSLQTMARDIASVQQEIGQLKASQAAQDINGGISGDISQSATAGCQPCAQARGDGSGDASQSASAGASAVAAPTTVGAAVRRRLCPLS